uniref:Reverse transcriptase domain-containing protein n=1 Tax=Tanacetum cinerariifolium TaxID=118510 RepID=A0A6L2NTQ6_TANCI|nr:reverse transcriptase domain-containing protein [Tanacetum cinerariifolium]
MSTRSSTRNLFPPLDNPELTIRRRSHADPTLLNDFEMVAEGNVPDLRTMEELCQPSLNGRGGPIAPIAIQAMNFGLKNDMIQQSIKVNGVTDDALRLYLFPHSLTHHATTWFDRFPRNSINIFEQMAKMLLGKNFPPSMVTKLRNEITDFLQRLDGSLFKAWEHYKLSIDRCPNHNMLPVTQIDTCYNGLNLRHRDTINAAAGGTFMKRHPEECYDLIKNITAHHNDWDTSAQQSESSSSITSSSDTEIAALKAKMTKINKNLMRVLHVNQQVKVVTPNCETCGGPHSFNDCPATVGNTQNAYATRAYQGGNSYQPQAYQAPAYKAPGYQDPVHQPQIPQPQVVTTNEFTNFMKFMKMNTASSSGSRTLPGNTITNPKEKLKGITTRSGTAYQGPTIPTTSSSFPPVVERETEATKDTVHPTNNGSTKDVQPLLSLPDLSPTCMTLELADHSISRPVGVAEDVYVKVGTFRFPANFVVVDFDADPRVPLILGRTFLKTEKALIDVFEGELTLCVGKEAITFNLYQTSRYSANYNDMTKNRIDVIDITSKIDKSSIDEPPEVELKDLPPHLKYAFLEGDDKLPVIIVKYLSDEEKTSLIMVLKSHKRAIAWKLSDIKGITQNFVLIKFSWRMTSNHRFNIREGSILKSMMSSRMRFLNSSMLD